MVLSGYSGFFHHYNWSPWHNWNIVENGVKIPNNQIKSNSFYYQKLCIVGEQVEVFVYTFDAGNRDATNSVAILNYSQHLYKLGIYSVDQPFKFKVKACTDVHVFMSSSQFMAYTYPFHNVVIGGSNGDKIFLRHVRDGKYYSLKEGTAVDDLLNCLNYREFWVTWRNATLKVGRGLIEGENQLDALLLQSSHVIDVRGIGIMTSHGSNGQWLVYKDGKYNIIIIICYVIKPILYWNLSYVM